MKKIIKNNLGLIVAIVVAFSIIGIVSCTVYTLKAPTKNTIEKYLQRDKANFDIIIKYFINSSYEEIYIDKINLKSGTMFTGANTGNIIIEDKNVQGAIEFLLTKRKYRAIGKDGNTIYFQKWVMLENERGIAYCIDVDKPSIEFLTKTESLSEDKWYYYEANYNEWRN